MKKVISHLLLAGFISLLLWLLLPAHYRAFIKHGYSNTDDYRIFYNHTIEKSLPKPWPKHPEYGVYNLSEADEEIHRQLASRAFLIIKDGSLLSENYYEGYNEATIHASFSVAKSIVSLLTGAALAEGKIKSLDDEVKKYLPELHYLDYNNVTIKNLLTMSSGIEWEENYNHPLCPPFKAYYGHDIERMIREYPFTQEPGKKWIYQSANTQLLGMIIEKATGQNLAQYASQKIWQTLGAENEALWSLDREDGHEKAFCCFNATARDYARVGQLVLDRGLWGGKQLIPASYILDATAPALELKNAEGKNCDWYGYQFWILHRHGMDIPYMRGFKGQLIFIVPDKNAVIVRLGDKVLLSDDDHHSTEIDALLDTGLHLIDKAEEKKAP